VAAPVLILRDQQLVGQLGDVPQPDLGAFALGAVGDRVRHRVDVARGAVVDDGDPHGMGEDGLTQRIRG
jgi:hypothetical protein